MTMVVLLMCSLILLLVDHIIHCHNFLCAALGVLALVILGSRCRLLGLFDVLLCSTFLLLRRDCCTDVESRLYHHRGVNFVVSETLSSMVAPAFCACLLLRCFLFFNRRVV